MCFWKKKIVVVEVPQPIEVESSALVLPHPEESQNLTATKGNTDLQSIVENWLDSWGVTDKEFWRSQVSRELIDGLAFPALTYSEIKLTQINPQWANPGVVAHESAHISYSFLSETEKAEFKTTLEENLKTSPLMKLLSEKNSYMNTNVVEAHAECYRFIGEKLPEIMKKFYPRLL